MKEQMEVKAQRRDTALKSTTVVYKLIIVSSFVSCVMLILSTDVKVTF